MRHKYFGAWLSEQQARQDPVGDLARDASTARRGVLRRRFIICGQKHSRMPTLWHELYVDLLYHHSACDSAKDAFCEASLEYTRKCGDFAIQYRSMQERILDTDPIKYPVWCTINCSTWANGCLGQHTALPWIHYTFEGVEISAEHDGNRRPYGPTTLEDIEAEDKQINPIIPMEGEDKLVNFLALFDLPAPNWMDIATAKHIRMSGVYVLINNGSCEYVGKSVDIGRRIKQHKGNGISFNSVGVIAITGTKVNGIEAGLIALMRPPRNVRYK